MPAHGEADIAVEKVGELKAVLVVMAVQRGDGVGGAVVADHPQARDLEGLAGEDLPLLRVDRGVYPCNRFLDHGKGSFRMSLRFCTMAVFECT